MTDSLSIILIEAIISFGKTANELISLLASEYDLDLESENPFGKLQTRKNNLWKGQLRNNWSYYFHGDACKFENGITGQLVDVKINRDGNYGTISDFYLFTYIETTGELQYVFERINSENLVTKILTELKESDIIIDIGRFPMETWVLNYKLLDENIVI
jgi:hypothetical protein